MFLQETRPHLEGIATQICVTNLSKKVRRRKPDLIQKGLRPPKVPLKFFVPALVGNQTSFRRDCDYHLNSFPGLFWKRRKPDLIQKGLRPLKFTFLAKPSKSQETRPHLEGIATFVPFFIPEKLISCRKPDLIQKGLRLHSRKAHLLIHCSWQETRPHLEGIATEKSILQIFYKLSVGNQTSFRRDCDFSSAVIFTPFVFVGNQTSFRRDCDSFSLFSFPFFICRKPDLIQKGLRQRQYCS